MTKPLNLGMIGYGFMGRAHSNAYCKVNNFFDLEHRPVLKAVCARSANKARAFADKWGYESVETDWRKLIGRKDIDLIDICTPNNTHAEIALAARRGRCRQRRQRRSARPLHRHCHVAQRRHRYG